MKMDKNSSGQSLRRAMRANREMNNVIPVQ